MITTSVVWMVQEDFTKCLLSKENTWSIRSLRHPQSNYNTIKLLQKSFKFVIIRRKQTADFVFIGKIPSILALQIQACCRTLHHGMSGQRLDTSHIHGSPTNDISFKFNLYDSISKFIFVNFMNTSHSKSVNLLFCVLFLCS